jgi:hypothetical protein
MSESQFAGDRMEIIEDDEGHMEIAFNNIGIGRSCGACTLCCRLLPIRELRKPAATKCPHQKFGKGCTIYAHRPTECRAWSCRWVSDRATVGMPRPDRCHYVIDMSYDHITMNPNDGGEAQRLSVFQVWCDPAFPMAYRAPELRAYTLMRAEKHGIGCIVRFDSAKAIVVLAPKFWDDGLWHEMSGGILVGEHRRQTV